MSLEITAYPTASGMSAALAGNTAGISIQGRFIGVGKGLQTIELDDAGRAITDRLINPVAWLEILSAKKISPYQWQLTVDIAGTNDGVEYNLGEIALSSAEDVVNANDHVISIYSSATQAMMTLSPQVDHALVGINLLFATMPADSVEIIHQNLPLELAVVDEMTAIMLSVGEMAVGMRESVDADISLRAESNLLQTVIDEQQLLIDQQRLALERQSQQLSVFESWKRQVDETLSEQSNFNAGVHRGFGALSAPN